LLNNELHLISVSQNYPASHFVQAKRSHVNSPVAVNYDGVIFDRMVETELFPCMRRLGVRFFAYNMVRNKLMLSQTLRFMSILYCKQINVISNVEVHEHTVL
jgi:hypothetical protein